MTTQEVTAQDLMDNLTELQKKYNTYKAMNLKLNISRGLPCEEQLELNKEMFHILNNEDCITEEGFDARNYGVMYGLSECKKLFAKLLDLPADNIIIGGNSSFNLIYDAFTRIYTFGTLGSKPWCRQEKLKFLCPVPGYDCHFNITEAYGFEMINIPMSKDGPDMNMIEELVAKDETIKGIWCVPLYSNPQGYCYSDETVERLAKMKTAASDFRIFWDNAYAVHHIYNEVKLKNIFYTAEKYGTQDRILYFFSTAKITFPGAGVSLIASGSNSIKEIQKYLKLQIFSHDKLNQLRHVKYLKTPENIHEHMKDYANILRPKFDLVDRILKENLIYEDLYEWFKPNGGYFITVDTYRGCAKKTLRMMEEAGVMVATAGSTYPYHKDPNDTNIRLAPTNPPVDSLQTAIQLFCICVNIAGIEQILSERK